MGLWGVFYDLDLREAKKTDLRSMHDCFIRELKDGKRPIDAGAKILVSPCDAIIGACGTVADTTLHQIKGFAYTLGDLMCDRDLVEQHRNGRYVTLRLTPSMYHRFHAPHDCRVEQVTYISGDTWNVNPIELRRCGKMFFEKESRLSKNTLHATPHLASPVALVRPPLPHPRLPVPRDLA